MKEHALSELISLIWLDPIFMFTSVAVFLFARHLLLHRAMATQLYVETRELAWRVVSTMCCVVPACFRSVVVGGEPARTLHLL